MSWQTMDTAPNDGTVVLTWHGGPYPVVAWFDRGKQLWQEVWKHEWTYPQQPYLWQPRPEDPP